MTIIALNVLFIQISKVFIHFLEKKPWLLSTGETQILPVPREALRHQLKSKLDQWNLCAWLEVYIYDMCICLINAVLEKTGSNFATKKHRLVFSISLI